MSQHTNRKLADLAEHLVETGELPGVDDLPRGRPEVTARPGCYRAACLAQGSPCGACWSPGVPGSSAPPSVSALTEAGLEPVVLDSLRPDVHRDAGRPHAGRPRRRRRPRRRGPGPGPPRHRRRRPPGGEGRARRGHRRHGRLRVEQRPRDRGPASPLCRRGRDAASSRPAPWSSTARAATPAPPTALVPPGPRSVEALRRREFEPPCPVCGRRPHPGTGHRGRAARPAEHVCGDEGRAGAPRRVLGAGDRRGRGLAAVPQRLRTRDAARHPVRRRGRPLPLQPRPRRGAAGLRGRRPAP